MKIRNGFVSNSSSSSFCILGTVVNEDEWFTSEQLEETDIDGLIEEGLSSKENSLTMEYGIDEYYEQYLVGRPVESLDVNKTIASLKEEIATEIQQVYNLTEKPKVEFCTDGGHEG